MNLSEIEKILTNNKFKLFGKYAMLSEHRYGNGRSEIEGSKRYIANRFLKEILSHKWNNFKCGCGASLFIRTDNEITHYKDKIHVSLLVPEEFYKLKECLYTEEEILVKGIVE